MKYIKFTYVNGNYMPDFDGLVFDFALTSQYPTNYPVFYGTCNVADGDGLIEVISKEVFDADRAAELIARDTKEKDQTAVYIAERRWRNETAGTMLYGRRIETDRTAVAMVTGAALAASLDPEYAVRWKAADGFVTLNAEQILAMAQIIRSHVQACFDREADLLEALESGTYEPEMLETGWPNSEELDDESFN